MTLLVVSHAVKYEENLHFLPSYIKHYGLIVSPFFMLFLTVCLLSVYPISQPSLL